MPSRTAGPRIHAGVNQFSHERGLWVMTQVIRHGYLASHGDYRKLAGSAPIETPVTQAALQRQLTMTSGHISKVTKPLLDSGYIIRDEGNEQHDTAVGAGRRPQPLLVNNKLAVLAVVVEDDYDGSDGGRRAVRVTAAPVGLNGRVIPPSKEIQLSPVTDDRTLLAKIADLAGKTLRKHEGHDLQWLGMSVMVGGEVTDGRLGFSANLGDRRGNSVVARDWEAELKTRTGLPTTIENDANGLALFDAWVAGRNYNNYLFITVKNDGIGCGIVYNGKPLRGPVGEIGHYPVDTRAVLDSDAGINELPTPGHSLTCSCGHIGCLEAYGTPNAIRRSLDWRFDDATIDALLDDWNCGRSPDKEHFDAAFKVRATVSRAGRALGIAIAGALHFAPVEAIVLGGDWLLDKHRGAGAVYLQGVHDALRRHFAYGTSEVRPGGGSGAPVIETLPIRFMPGASDEVALASCALSQFAYGLDERPGIYDVGAEAE